MDINIYSKYNLFKNDKKINLIFIKVNVKY